MKRDASSSKSFEKDISRSASEVDLRSEVIATCARPRCSLCGEAGTQLYEALKDELFGSPGSWGIMRCGNPECGLIWLDPAPLASELPKAYFDYYTHTQGNVIEPIASGGWFRARLIGLYGHLVHYSGLLERRRIMLIRHLDGMEPGRLLEIGCGDGSFLSAARELGWEVTGVDSDPQAAQAAREKHDIVVQVRSFEDCNFPLEHFDLIVMNHVIEHVLDPVTLLVSCAAILRTDGVLLLVTPNSEGLGHSVFGRNWRGLEPPRHLQIFSPGALAKTTQGTGLRCVHLNTTSVNAEAIYWGSTDPGGASNPQPLRFLFMSWLYQYYALARNLWDRKGGEEIVMVCRKSSQVSTTD